MKLCTVQLNKLELGGKVEGLNASGLDMVLHQLHGYGGNVSARDSTRERGVSVDTGP